MMVLYLDPLGLCSRRGPVALLRGCHRHKARAGSAILALYTRFPVLFNGIEAAMVLTLKYHIPSTICRIY